MVRANTLDFTNQEEAARVLPQAPLVDSYGAGWQGLTFTHYCHPPHETLEHCLLQHALVVTAPQSCFQAERCLGGKFRRYAHGNGRIDVIPAFLSRWASWNRQVEFSVIALCPALLNRTAQQGQMELIPQLSISDPVIAQLAIALKLELQTGCLSGRLYGESLAAALAARLGQNYAARQPKCSASGLSPAQLQRIVDYIQANLAQDMSVLDLATLTCLSASHFSRSFRKSVGISPYQYLIRQRVERAKQLLEGRSRPIRDVALECGFANQTHLTKVFHRMTGTTPKTYQTRHSTF